MSNRIITASEFLAVAKEQVGTTEGKGGVTKYGKWYGDRHRDSSFDAAPWCDMSLGWIAYEAGRRKAGKEGAEAALDQVGEFAYTVYHAQWFAKQGRFSNKAHVGDIIFFDWAQSHNIGAIDHVGVVAGKTSDGRLVTYEGNTNNGYYKRYRSYANAVGFGHPFWLSQAKTDITTVKPASNTMKPASSKFPLPAGHWFGTESLVTANHSGAVAADRPKVKQLQTALNKAGYKLEVDGRYGPKTKTAVMDFQRKHDLTVDGEAGILTWRKLTSK